MMKAGVFRPQKLDVLHLPAIANALEDAVGVRLTELPLNPETVLRAIKAKSGSPREDK
jgi:hypothetical protein